MKWLLVLLFIPVMASAQIEDRFARGTQELGLANIGLGYSEPGGFNFSANARYQYYFVDRLAGGGAAFYNNFRDREWMGFGPALSYILFTFREFFARLDQQITFSKANGFDDPPASTYGTTGISVNYLPVMSNFFIGVGYAKNYALSSGDVIFPDSVVVAAGVFWNM